MADHGNPFSSPDAGGAAAEAPTRMRRIRRFGILQLGKVFGVLYFGLSLLLVPFVVLMSVFGEGRGGGGFAMGAGMAVVLPIFYGIFGFVFGVIFALVYNVVARLVGGIEVEVEVEAD